MLECLKTLVAGKPEERVARQRGTFLAVYETKKYPCKFQSMGTKSGERALVQFDDPRIKKFRITDNGMKPEQSDALKAVLLERKGIVLVSAPVGGGLTSLMTATVAGVDRFMWTAIALEDAHNRELDVENVPVKTYDIAAGVAPAATLLEIVRQYPDVIVAPELIDVGIATTLCEQAVDGKLVIAGIRAREAAEAMLRVLVLKVPLKLFVPNIAAVVNQRLVRKLCTACREEYPAPAPVLQNLKLSPDKVKVFYRPPTPKPGEKPKICPECNGSGYRGQTAMFEVLIVNDAVRSSLVKQPTLESVRLAAQKAGMKTLQESGIQLIADGITSLPELKRILTEKEGS